MPQEAPVKVAVVQASPVFLDRDATVERACDLIAEAGRNGANLVVFPEAFIPAYPEWVWRVPPAENRLLTELYAEYLEHSIRLPGPESALLGEAARAAGTYVAMGASERNHEASDSSLYNTLFYLDPAGRLIARHRKLVPTAPERMVWAQGDGSTLEVLETSFGRLGGLICWENYMPLARYALYAGGIQVYLAPTWDRGEPWLSTLRHIAKEGRVYVVGCCAAVRRNDIPDRLEVKGRYYTDASEWINPGDSAVVDPDGKFVAGPLHAEQGILYADLDLQKVMGSRWKLDVAGHYGRPDVFKLRVNRAAHPAISSGPRQVEDPGEPFVDEEAR
jgi:nitrilase